MKGLVKVAFVFKDIKCEECGKVYDWPSVMKKVSPLVQLERVQCPECQHKENVAWNGKELINL